MSDFEQEFKKLTEDQQKQIKQLSKRTMIRMSIKMSGAFGLLLLSNMIVALLDGMYINSETFVFSASVLNAFMFMYLFRSGLNAERDRVKEEVENILNNK